MKLKLFLIFMFLIISYRNKTFKKITMVMFLEYLVRDTFDTHWEGGGGLI
jgi:hypothetical protein